MTWSDRALAAAKAAQRQARDLSFCEQLSRKERFEFRREAVRLDAVIARIQERAK